jgi:hypothetical protein
MLKVTSWAPISYSAAVIGVSFIDPLLSKLKLSFSGLMSFLHATELPRRSKKFRKTSCPLDPRAREEAARLRLSSTSRVWRQRSSLSAKAVEL